MFKTQNLTFSFGDRRPCKTNLSRSFQLDALFSLPLEDILQGLGCFQPFAVNLKLLRSTRLLHKIIEPFWGQLFLETDFLGKAPFFFLVFSLRFEFFCFLVFQHNVEGWTQCQQVASTCHCVDRSLLTLFRRIEIKFRSWSSMKLHGKREENKKIGLKERKFILDQWALT